MRAFDILLFLVCLEATIGFVASLHVFPVSYIDPSAVHGDWSLVEVQEQVEASQQGFFDKMMLVTDMLFKALGMFFNMMVAIVAIYVPLTSVLGVPSEVALLVQSVVYVVYVWALIQFLSGRSIKYME
ncbi:MAG: hypothetical protein ACXQT6_01300 [Candidatus Methanospirareceae archaeon]